MMNFGSLIYDIGCRRLFMVKIRFPFLFSLNSLNFTFYMFDKVLLTDFLYYSYVS